MTFSKISNDKNKLFDLNLTSKVLIFFKHKIAHTIW